MNKEPDYNIKEAVLDCYLLLIHSLVAVFVCHNDLDGVIVCLVFYS